jgi:hypothetical protein
VIEQRKILNNKDTSKHSRLLSDDTKRGVAERIEDGTTGQASLLLSGVKATSENKSSLLKHPTQPSANRKNAASRKASSGVKTGRLTPSLKRRAAKAAALTKGASTLFDEEKDTDYVALAYGSTVVIPDMPLSPKAQERQRRRLANKKRQSQLFNKKQLAKTAALAKGTSTLFDEEKDTDCVALAYGLKPSSNSNKGTTSKTTPGTTPGTTPRRNKSAYEKSRTVSTPASTSTPAPTQSEAMRQIRTSQAGKNRQIQKALRKRKRLELQISSLKQNSRVQGVARATGAATQGVHVAARETTKRGIAAFVSSVAGIASSIGAALLPILIIVLVVLMMFFVLVVGNEELNKVEVSGDLTENERIVATYLLGKGLDELHVAAIMGNISMECMFDPALIENGSAQGVGIFQWPTTTDGGHGMKMIAYAQSTGRSGSDLNAQLDYAWYEISSSADGLPGNVAAYGNGGQWCWNREAGCTAFLAQYSIPRSQAASFAVFNAITDIEEATAYFCWGFLRPATASAHVDTRINGDSSGHHGAKYYYSILKGGDYSVVERAYAELGKPYVWGAVGPDSYDCSGFVGYCLTGEYRRWCTTETMMNWLEVTDPIPGDICVSQTHCGLYIGNGQMIHAPRTGDVVKISSVPSTMKYVRYTP